MHVHTNIGGIIKEEERESKPFNPKTIIFSINHTKSVYIRINPLFTLATGHLKIEIIFYIHMSPL